MKRSNTSLFLKQPPVLPTPLFLWEKFEPPTLFAKISKTQPPPSPHFRKTYFETQLRTVASVYSLSELVVHMCLEEELSLRKIAGKCAQ